MSDTTEQERLDALDAHPEVLALTATSNPYLDFYRDFCATQQQELFDVFDPAIAEKKRAKLYASLDVSVAMKYSWAIPDERALRILKHYGPIVEMGAGNGYWGKLLQLRGVDIVCYDLHVAGDDNENHDGGDEQTTVESDGIELDGDDEQQSVTASDDVAEQSESGSDNDSEHVAEEGDDASTGEQQQSADAETKEQNESVGDGESEYGGEDEDEEVEVEQIYWTDVLKGTPKDLRKHANRTLFLCYPDDFEDSDESMALQCLYHYAGDTVVHVGELFGQSVCRPGAWGRTSAQEFQEHLASSYHKVLQVPLPSWHSSIDTLTVWKRTKPAMIGRAVYAFIPADERLELVDACASTRHLLDAHSDDDGDVAASPPFKRIKS